MSGPSIIETYCKFCGSADIIEVQVDESTQKNRIIHPELKIGIAPLSFEGRAISWGREKNKSVSYGTYHCRTCYNINVKHDLNYVPLILSTLSQQKKKIVIFPYSLFIVLKHDDYKENDIQALLKDEILDNLEKIYKKWKEKGQNPCKKGRLGYKLKIKQICIECYVIITYFKDDLCFRFIYGGNEIECP